MSLTHATTLNNWSVFKKPLSCLGTSHARTRARVKVRVQTETDRAERWLYKYYKYIYIFPTRGINITQHTILQKVYWNSSKSAFQKWKKRRNAKEKAFVEAQTVEASNPTTTIKRQSALLTSPRQNPRLLQTAPRFPASFFILTTNRKLFCRVGISVALVLLALAQQHRR